jgi:hypothetical protein
MILSAPNLLAQILTHQRVKSPRRAQRDLEADLRVVNPRRARNLRRDLKGLRDLRDQNHPHPKAATEMT